MKQALLAAGLATLLGATGCAQVGPGEVGMITEFGKLESNLYDSGLHFYNPFTSHFIVQSVQKQTVASDDKENGLSGTPSTADQLPIRISYSIIYYIPKSQVLSLYTNVKGDPFESLVVPRVNEALRTVVSQYRSDEVTSKSAEIQEKVATLANKLVGESLEIVDVPITHIELPQTLREAITEKQDMEIQAKKKQFELDREKLQAQITLTQANAQAQAMKVQSDALAKSPQLIEYTKAKSWDGHLPQTVVTGGSGLLFSLK